MLRVFSRGLLSAGLVLGLCVAVAATQPALAAKKGPILSGLFAFVWAAGLVFCRTAFFDIMDMQGDRIVGKETIPILIGERRAFTLLKYLLVSLALLLVAAGLTLTIACAAFINFFVVLGMAPTKGLALPFFTYGGSSIVSTLAAVGILINVANYTAISRGGA